MSLSIAIVNIIPAIGLDGCFVFLYLFKYFRFKKVYYSESGALESLVFGMIDSNIENENMKMYRPLIWIIRLGTIATFLLVVGSLLRDLRLGF